MQFVVPFAGTEAEAWESLTAALGVKGVSVGQRWTAPAGVPAFSGVAEYYTENPYDALLRLDKPGPGIAALGAFNCGGPSMVALNFYLYGDQAAGTVARETPLWQAWFQDASRRRPSRARATNCVIRREWFHDDRASRDGHPGFHPVVIKHLHSHNEKALRRSRRRACLEE